ncbi:MAG: universal stress protein [Methanoregula sp.]|nr:universal stress protein [Methanoregula sp.]
MFTNILVALDGSEVSHLALVQAVDQARIWDAKIQAIYIAETPQFNSLPIDQTYGMDTTFEMNRVIEKAEESEGELVLENAKKYCAERGITLTTHLKYGDTGNEIISLAEQEKTDLIVIGSHGKGGIDRLLSGSVSSYVVTHGKVTTMVVRS